MLWSLKLFAHQEGHGSTLKEWRLTTQKAILKADYIKSENNTVWLMDFNHNINTYPVSDFSMKDQKYIATRNTLIHDLNNNFNTGKESFSISNIVLFVFGGLLLVFSIFQFKKLKNFVHLTYGFLGLSIMLFISCTTSKNNKTVNILVPRNNIALMQSFFEKFDGVKTSSDENFLYVSSNGLPDHDMMIGITNWQQQVPIHQNYTGDNSWAIPLNPKLAANPLSTKTNLLKGAIAVAVNGIPIFNPLNNRGEDANAIGELDQWGGHCGRADDYHYHLPPLHLQEQVGKGNPIAYAVDGFPVYGETTDTLDAYLGKMNSDGSYQYHSIKTYPYFIAGMRGEVKLDPHSKAPENQVSPQPRTHELRPALRPLRGAEIVYFKKISNSHFVLTYQLNDQKHIIEYNWDSSGNYTYKFIEEDGTTIIENYTSKKK